MSIEVQYRIVISTAIRNIIVREGKVKWLKEIKENSQVSTSPILLPLITKFFIFSTSHLPAMIQQLSMASELKDLWHLCDFCLK